MADSDNDSGGHTNAASPREQDRFLPIANVSRIMKLPRSPKTLRKLSRCVSPSSSASSPVKPLISARERRKTIIGDDLLWAMTTLGFEEYAEPLKIYLQKFREMEGEKTALAGSSGGRQGERSKRRRRRRRC